MDSDQTACREIIGGRNGFLDKVGKNIKEEQNSKYQNKKIMQINKNISEIIEENV